MPQAWQRDSTPARSSRGLWPLTLGCRELGPASTSADFGLLHNGGKNRSDVLLPAEEQRASLLAESLRDVVGYVNLQSRHAAIVAAWARSRDAFWLARSPS